MLTSLSFLHLSLLLLWLLWALFLFGGFIFGSPHENNSRRMPRWTRMCSSAALVLAAWSTYAFLSSEETRDFMLLIALGMTLGFVGDLLMAELLSFPISHILGGMTAFGLGHIAYILGLFAIGETFALDNPTLLWGALISWWLIAIVGWYIVVFRGQHPTILHYAALPYALLLATTTGVATGLAFQAPLFAPLALGAALFLLSDLILAAQLFNELHFPLISDVVWLTYGPGQMLIVFAACVIGMGY